MKKGLFIALTSCAAFVLCACGNNTGVKTMTITNKDALQAEFHVGDASRKIELTSDPAINPAEAVAAGDLVAKVGDANVLTAAGITISPVGVGTTTVEILYKNYKFDEVSIEVKAKQTAKEKYGTVHAGTEDDPLDNADGITVGKKLKETSVTSTEEAYYIKGKIDTFYHAPGSRTDGACSWYLEPAQTGGEKFEVYKCYKDEAGTSFLTNDDVWKGAEVLAHGKITFYNDQMETSSAVFDKVTGGDPKPEPKKTIEATVAQALEAGKAMEDGDSSWDKYAVTGYVVKKDGTNYFLADSKTADTSDVKALYEVYGASADVQAKLLKGAKVKVTAEIKNYHGQIENGVSDFGFELLQAGEPWVINYEEITAAKAFELLDGVTPEDGKTVYVGENKYYSVSNLVVTELKEWSEQYKNVDVYVAEKDGDANKTIQCFRFADKEVFDKLAVGTEVVVKSQLAVYKKNAESAKVYETAQKPIIEIVEPGVKSETAAISASVFTVAADGLTATATVGGVTFNWAKNTSTTAFRNSDTDHLRVYKGSDLRFVYGKSISKIEVTCTTADYATQAAASTIIGGTAVANDAVVTLTPSAEGTTEMGITASVNQWRLSSITVFYAE